MAVREDEDWEDTVEFLRNSSASPEFLNFYRDMAHGVVSDPSIPMPDIAQKDMDYFQETVNQMPKI